MWAEGSGTSPDKGAAGPSSDFADVPGRGARDRESLPHVFVL